MGKCGDGQWALDKGNINSSKAIRRRDENGISGRGDLLLTLTFEDKRASGPWVHTQK
jgi:hypothetical protein